MSVDTQSLPNMKNTHMNDKDSNESVINQSTSTLGNSIDCRRNEIDNQLSENHLIHNESSDSQMPSSIDETDKILMSNEAETT